MINQLFCTDTAIPCLCSLTCNYDTLLVLYIAMYSFGRAQTARTQTNVQFVVASVKLLQASGLRLVVEG